MRWALVFVACASTTTSSGQHAAAGAGATDGETPTSFCDALRDGDQMAATEALHDALVESGASKQRDGTDALASWLRAVPCAFSVEVDPHLIDVAPPVRKLRVVVKIGSDRVACDAELRLMVGGQVALIGCKRLRGA